MRELRQQASRLLRRAEAGETIEITDRGRPVAILAPVPDDGDPLERMKALGQVEAASIDFDELPPPIPLRASQDPPSSVLARLREHEH